MASVIAIYNAALIKLGAQPIELPDDPSDNAIALRTRYAAVRDGELRKRRWRFSIKRAALAADADVPLSGSGYGLQYTLPADCLRVLELGTTNITISYAPYAVGMRADFAIEGNRILSNTAAPLHIRYIARITDPGLFDAAFSESFAARLAYECCERITQSSSKKSDLFNDYRFCLREAVQANALERPPQDIDDDSWIYARVS